jgi:hypothetical protein
MTLLEAKTFFIRSFILVFAIALAAMMADNVAAYFEPPVLIEGC